MTDVTNLTVAQIRVFAVDAIPFGEIATKSRVQAVAGALGTSQIEVAPLVEATVPIVFGRGEVRKGERLVVVNKVIIEPRRIILEVAGTSAEASEIYDSMLSSLKVSGIDTSALRKPLLLTETTQCVASLSFALDSLFQAHFTKFMSQVGRLASSAAADGAVVPRHIELEVNYAVKDAAIIDNKITLAPKRLVIAAREGLPSGTRRYLLISPFDSDTHLQLIRDLERSVTRSAAKS